ncbi:hypothetical protein [Streptomyces sp. S.PNR 29]|uniref:hypothetical protein n=1 Tax=Streptomyces sp. S.PNR 29 TaxID=2973805 RepID=UPI0025B240A9|nr:hypothetical protein [Streptomyces sp. S.PNR 29]MDN0198769.1 hypothetical protein [Streptomyces sp. S.PNR 29]
MRTRENGPQDYTDAFLRAARPAVQDLCEERRGAAFDSLTPEDLADATGGLVVGATAVVFFRGHGCVFRRGIWPPVHPAATRAALYATVLEERLLTGVAPRADGTISTIDL